VVVNESDNRVYLRCHDFVAYMDATTGACLGGSQATTGLPGEVGSLVYDASSGKLFSSAECQDNGGYQTIFELDPVNPQYVNGTRDNSQLPGAPAACGYAALQGYGDGQLFVWGGGPLLTIDAATGNVVSSVGFSTSATSFEADPEHDLVRFAFEFYPYDFLSIRKLSDFDHATGDAESSILEVPAYEFYPTIVPAPGSEYSLVIGRNQITRVRRDSAALFDSSRTLGGTVVPTGDHPSAVASMPALTGY
jgi:hypothetical protein